MSTLASLTSYTPAHRFNPYLVSGNPNSKSLLSSLLPNIHGKGPIASLMRVVVKVHQYTFRRLSNSFGRDNNNIGMSSKKKDREQKGKAIKVVDLLEHSAELGNMDAIYTLAHIYLVRTSYLFAVVT